MFVLVVDDMRIPSITPCMSFSSPDEENDVLSYQSYCPCMHVDMRHQHEYQANDSLLLVSFFCFLFESSRKESWFLARAWFVISS
jgi:hypothetical protein